MFDPLPGRRHAYERYVLGLDDEEELDEEDEEESGFWDDIEERRYHFGHFGPDDDDAEPSMARLARLAADIEAGRAEPPTGWNLDRPSPGVLVWTTPSGRRYACDLTGKFLPLP